MLPLPLLLTTMPSELSEATEATETKSETVEFKSNSHYEQESPNITKSVQPEATPTAKPQQA
jgi:hypothetical protein